jgi:S-adenosylmethionine decarboxylase
MSALNVLHRRNRLTEPNTVVARASGMRLHAMDAWLRDPAILTDSDRLRSLLYRAAAAGGTTVLADEFYVFPNGAVTGVLLLAQSHLSIHTWPELHLANIDLLTYGNVDADAALDVLRNGLEAERLSVVAVTRGTA